MDVSTVRRANAGDAEAQYTLGEMYDSGDGVPKDSVAAVNWFRKAAEQGHAQAQWQLGIKYAYGKGVPQDAVEAVVWFRKAADQGDAPAQFALGWMYRRGEGVSQDKVEAAAWFRKAAEQGLESAQSALAVMDPVVIRAFKKAYPTDGAVRIKRLREGHLLTDDELEMLDDLIRNEGRVYLTFQGKGADYDEDDPSDVDLYDIDVKGLGGIYFVEGNEFGDSELFHSLDDAEAYVSDHWAGVDIFGPDEIRPPFGEKKNKENVKKKNVKKKSAKKKSAKKKSAKKKVSR